jgi:sigma-B regulation protein RsbU (phosphoserine phosphatase)
MTAELPAAAPKRVLIVEDDRNLNQSLVRKFQRLGFEVIGCYNGEQGIERLAAEPFDCVLLDLMMPVKDGFAVLAKKPSTPNAHTPAYVLTGLGQDEKLALARELGARSVFNKSEMSPAEVAATIQRELLAH